MSSGTNSISEPGAARQGNFINYYQFNPAEKRISLLPRDLLKHAQNKEGDKLCLDIGCNTGVSEDEEATFSVQE